MRLCFGNCHEQLARKARVVVSRKTEVRRKDDLVYAFPVISGPFRIDRGDAEVDFRIGELFRPEFEHSHGKERLRVETVRAGFLLAEGVVQFFAERVSVGVEPGENLQVREFALDGLDSFERRKSGWDKVRVLRRVSTDEQHLFQPCAD